MSHETLGRVGWSFWLIALAALIWHAMGSVNFVMQLDPEAIASFPDSHRAVIENRPAWGTAAFGISVFGGVVGAVLLLMRKALAAHAFALALLGTIVVMIQSIGSVGGFSAFELVLMVAMPVAVPAYLILYARKVQARGWIT